MSARSYAVALASNFPFLLFSSGGRKLVKRSETCSGERGECHIGGTEFLSRGEKKNFPIKIKTLSSEKNISEEKNQISA